MKMQSTLVTGNQEELGAQSPDWRALVTAAAPPPQAGSRSAPQGSDKHHLLMSDQCLVMHSEHQQMQMLIN